MKLLALCIVVLCVVGIGVIVALGRLFARVAVLEYRADAAETKAAVQAKLLEAFKQDVKEAFTAQYRSLENAAAYSFRQSEQNQIFHQRLENLEQRGKVVPFRRPH